MWPTSHTMNQNPTKYDFDIPVERFGANIHRYQAMALDAFDMQKKRYLWLNWHRRARKTTLLLNLLLREAATNNDTTYDYVGPTYKQAKAIVWRDPNMLNAYLPDIARLPWQKNESELFIHFKKTNSFLFIRGADNPDSLRGTNAVGVAFDEWALIDPVAWLEVYRPIITASPDRWAAFGFTPKGQNHAYEGILRAEEDPESYVSTLPASISKLIPQDELDKAKAEMPPELYMQEFECSFIAEEEFGFITSAALDALRGIVYVEDQPRTFIAVDPATGGDECVAKVFRNIREIDQRIYHHRDEMKIVAELQVLANSHNTKNIVIESIGIGGGIASRLSEIGLNVFNFEPGSKATDSDHFANKKAEMWWEVSKMVRNGEAEYPEDLLTRQQICSVKYKMQSNTGRLICEPKELTKKRIGHSPDRADAWVIGMYHWRDFEPDNAITTRSARPDYVGLGVG